MCNALQWAWAVHMTMFFFEAVRMRRGCWSKTTVAVEQVCGVAAGKRFNTSVCSPSSSCLPVGSVTNSAVLFKTFQLTAGKPEGAASIHLPLSRPCSPARSDLLEVKGGGGGIAAHQQFEGIKERSWKWLLCEICKTSDGQRASTSLERSFHNKLWCFVQVPTMLWASKECWPVYLYAATCAAALWAPIRLKKIESLWNNVQNEFQNQGLYITLCDNTLHTLRLCTKDL